MFMSHPIPQTYKIYINGPSGIRFLPCICVSTCANPYRTSNIEQLPLVPALRRVRRIQKAATREFKHLPSSLPSYIIFRTPVIRFQDAVIAVIQDPYPMFFLSEEAERKYHFLPRPAIATFSPPLHPNTSHSSASQLSTPHPRLFPSLHSPPYFPPRSPSH